MPERSDFLEDYLDAVRRQSLRELFCDYRVSMVSCSYFRNHAPWSVNWRICPDGFFLFPTLGTLRVKLETGSVELKPGQFLMLNEGIRHALEVGGESTRLHQLSLHCHVTNRWGHSFLARCHTAIGTLSTRDGLFESLKELTCLKNRDPEAGQQRGESLVKELLALQLRKGLHLARGKQEGDPRIAGVLKKMETEFASCDLSVEELAREIQLTPVQFRKLFQRETHLSPKRFLNRLRMRHATSLLRQTTASVKQIAAECGFASDHYFHLAFRKELGCTPSGYRLNRMSDL